MHSRIIRHRLWTVVAAGMGLVIVIAACGNRTNGRIYGTPIPKGIEPMPLEQILANPKQYDGKELVMVGVVAGQCPSLCEFYFTDGRNTVEIFPKGFALPRMEKGRRVSVFVRVTKGEERLVLSALGLTLEKKQK